MKKYSLHILLLLCFGLFCTYVQAQQTSAGKEFWVSFGPNSSNSIIRDGALQIRIIATKACAVTLTYSSGIPGKTINMAAGQVLTDTVSSTLYHGINSTGRSSKSLKVTSTQDIYLYALNQLRASTEATAVFPVPTYGTEYYHFSYTTYRTTSTYRDGFLVIAHEDQTQVRIDNNAPAVVLSAGQVWYHGGNFGSDITGTRIRVSKPAAVFSVNSGARVVAGGYDCLFEQMVSIDKWGMQFFVPVTSLGEERVRIVASENNTAVQVQFQSSVSNYTINRGNYREITVSSSSRGAYITANKPIGVSTYMIGRDNGSGDPSLAWIPAIPQMVTDTVTIAPFQPIGETQLSTHYSQIVVRTSDKSETRRYSTATGSWGPVTSQWTDHRSGYSYTYEVMASNNTSNVYFRYHNPAGVIVWGYGRGSYESYHYMTAGTFKRLDCQMYINGISSEELDGAKLNTCKGLDIEGEVTVPVNPSQSYIVWYIDGQLQTLARNTLKWTTPDLSPGTHTIRMVATSSAGAQIPLECTLEITGEDYIWTGAAGDSNWNNPANWILTDGSKTVLIPKECHKVFIPGGLDTYPSLEDAVLQSGTIKTPAECNEIIFHFSGELAWPHKLTYNKAYCEYNFGYYKSFAGISTGDAPGNNRDDELYGSAITGYTAPMMKRSRFYYLSFPLKKIATGDLSLAGYPKTYASVLGKPENDKLASITPNGNFYDFAYNGILLEELRNAALLQVSGYNSTQTGANDHTNLEGLKGVIRLPYFEDSISRAFYPQHAYSFLDKESYLYYFDDKTLQIMYGLRDTVSRAEEACRFIFEDDNKQVKRIVLPDGSTVPGYSVKIRSDDDHFYLGNPFPASINSGLFRDVNAPYLDTSRPSFTLLKNDGTSGEELYAYNQSNHIPSFSGFGVYINNNSKGKEIEWFFPLEGNYALTGRNYLGVFPLAFDNSAKAYLAYEGSSDYDRAVLASPDDYGVDLPKTNLPPADDHVKPEVFFTTPAAETNFAAEATEERNMLQVMEDENSRINIAIRTNDTENPLQLVFDGIENMLQSILRKDTERKNKTFILEDLRTGEKIDLLNNSYYVFKQVLNGNDNNFTDQERFALYIYEDSNPNNIRVIFSDGRLNIFSMEGIKSFGVYNVMGQKIIERTGLSAQDKNHSEVFIVPAGIYLVRITDYSDKKETQKIFVR